MPTLVAVTVLAFWALSKTLAPAETSAGSGLGSAPPLFFNPEPATVRELSWDAAQAVANTADAPDAARMLVELGGASLPHIWPRIDGLPPIGRQRVARALAPVAYRMGVAEVGSLQDPDLALSFWNRFWRDRSVDFRDPTLRRVVRRYAQRTTTLRKRELRQFDTFALSAIIDQLATPETGADIDAQRRLCAAAAHATELEWTIPPGASPSEARAIVSRWQHWWTQHHSRFVGTQGIERLVAPVLQTRYALWAREAARAQFGLTSSGQPALQLLLARAPVTLALLASGLFGGTLVGLVVGALIGVLRKRGVTWAEPLTNVLTLALPAALVFAWRGTDHSTQRPWLAMALMLLLGAAIVARYQRTTVLSLLDQAWVRTYRAGGVSRVRIALLTLRASSGAAISTIAPYLSTLLTIAFVLEHAFRIEGVGRQTIIALHEGDVVWLMLVTLATATLVGLVQIASDVLLARLDPRQAQPDDLELSVG